MKFIIINFIVLITLTPSQNTLLDNFKTISSPFNGRQEIFNVPSINAKNTKELSDQFYKKYFANFFQIEHIEALEQMETLEDLGTVKRKDAVYPICRYSNSNKKDFLFLLVDTKDFDYRVYCATYDSKKDKINNVKIVFSYYRSEASNFNFVVCKDTLTIIDYKSVKIKSKKKNDYRVLFKVNKFLLDQKFTLVKSDSMFATQKGYAVFNQTSPSDDPIWKKCN